MLLGLVLAACSGPALILYAHLHPWAFVNALLVTVVVTLFCPADTLFMHLHLQNGEVLRDLKFGIGDGQLHYYLYNWRVGSMLAPHEVGLILM
jgi:hypothetical protein